MHAEEYGADGGCRDWSPSLSALSALAACPPGISGSSDPIINATSQDLITCGEAD